ncbi:MAG TPA: hypothetical protein VKQ72_07080, partial [Aggregatilineales bacterium]|nr:hypothetical protein [Aggregatilineales bacterium]
MSKSRETMIEPAAKPALPHRVRQLRTFALAWTGLTLFFGACTFISIYAATGAAANSASIASKGIPPASVAQVATPTLGNSPVDATGATDQQTQASAGDVPTLVQGDQGILPTATGLELVPSLIPQGANNSAAIPTNTPPANGSSQSAAQPNPVTATPNPPTAGPTATKIPTKTAAPPTPTILPIKDTSFDLGIAVQDNPDPNTYKNWVHSVGADLKLNWMKAQVVWRDTEKVKGKIDWTAMDVEIKQMSTANIKILLSITHAPDWAR